MFTPPAPNPPPGIPPGIPPRDFQARACSASNPERSESSPNSSYSARRCSSPSTSWAAEISLNRGSAPGSLFRSGWYFWASVRKAFLIWAWSAVLGTPSAA